MRQARIAAAVLVTLVGLSGCGSPPASSGTVQGTVVRSPSCPVVTSPVVPPAGSPTPTPSDDACRRGSVDGTTVQAFKAGSDEVAASVPVTGDGRFECDLPEGSYRFEAVPSSAAQGHGVPLDVVVQTGSTVEVTLRIDTGVR